MSCGNLGKTEYDHALDCVSVIELVVAHVLAERAGPDGVAAVPGSAATAHIEGDRAKHSIDNGVHLSKP